MSRTDPVEILNLMQHLGNLLVDPQPGLSTWCDARAAAAQALYDALDGIVASPARPAPADTFASALETLTGITLRTCTPAQIAALVKDGTATEPDGTPLRDLFGLTQRALFVQMYPVWWENYARTSDTEITLEDGYEIADSGVGDVWIEMGDKAYRLPSEITLV